jgi:hypothetical protein
VLRCWVIGSSIGLAEHHQSYSYFELRCPRVRRWTQVSHLLRLLCLCAMLDARSPGIDRPYRESTGTPLQTRRYAWTGAPTFTVPLPRVDTKPVTASPTADARQLKDANTFQPSSSPGPGRSGVHYLGGPLQQSKQQASSHYRPSSRLPAQPSKYSQALHHQQHAKPLISETQL